MEKLIIKIVTRSNKGKHLFGLNTDMAKEGSFIKIQKTQTPKELKASLNELKAGIRKPINEYFKSTLLSKA